MKGEAGPWAFDLTDTDNCSMIHLIMKKMFNEQIQEILVGKIDWEKECKCNECGTLDLEGLSLNEHKKICPTLTVGKDLFTCPACKYSCSEKERLDEHQDHCQAPTKRK